jgi:3-oxoacyl-(acyl-carrier-protein) synthase
VQILRDSPRAASPFLFTDCVANAPCGQLAIAVTSHAANTTIVQREAGPLASLIQACRDLDRDRADAVLVGAVDEIDDYQRIILDRMGALAPGAADFAPFDARRCGTLLGEGAASVVVETAAHAARRQAPVRARVVSTCRAFDPSAPPANWGRGGIALGDRLRRTLAADGIDLASVGAVVAGASGSRDGDRLEAAVLRAVFGATPPPILVPKAVLGEYGGGTLVPGVLALDGGAFSRPVGFRRTDPDLGVTPFGGMLPPPQRVLLSALASGGAATWAVLERP